MRLNKPLAGLAVASLAVLAACGGSSDDGSGGKGGTSEPSVNLSETAGQNMDDTATGPYTGPEGATKGGTLNVIGASGDMSTTLDPRGAYYSDTISILGSFLVRSLTQWKYDDASGNMVLVPDLATDLGEPNSDYTQWTFHLKPGLKYQDGTPIKAADIAYSVSSSLDCDTFTDCPSNYLLGTLTGSGDVKKDGDIASGIQTPDDNTIIFNFDKPFADMSYYSFFPLFSPIPQSVGSDIANYPKNLVATGPYKIASFTPGKSLDLVRNDQWDPNSDPARAALPDEVKFDTTYNDPKKVDAVILASKGDGATTLSYDDIDSSDIQTFQSQAPDQVSQGSTPLTNWLAPDNSQVPVEVRKAITWAYPYEAAAKAAGLIPNVNWLPTTTLEAPGVPGRQEVNGVPDHQAGQTDADKAKQILADSGNTGFELKWLYLTDSPTSVKTMQVVKAAYEKAGFKASPVATTSTDYAAKRSDPTTPINIRSGGWFSDWPSGYSWIPTVFGPADNTVDCAAQKWETFGVVNYAKFCEDDINADITKVEAMPIDDQPKAWSDLENTIQTKYYPIIPTYNGGVIQAHGTSLQGVNIDITGGLPTWKDIWIKS
jgi:peptide/nickel transport system substrate-binding protein